MKNIIKLLSLILVLIVSITSIACNNSTPPSDEGGETNDKQFDVVKDANGQDVYIVENGNSAYDIVIPDQPNVYEELASNELQLFIQQATGATLQIKKLGAINSAEGKHIFIGRAAGKESIVTDAEYGANGAYIDVENENLYLTGAQGYGITNSVYQFLKYEIDWRIYAYDEIYFEPTAKLALLDFQDFKYKPYYDYSVWRAHYSYGYGNRISATRMGQLQASNRGGSTLEGQLYSAFLSNLDSLIPVSTANDLMLETHGDELNTLVEERLSSYGDLEKEAMREKVRQEIIEEKGWSWYINGQLCLSKPEVRDELYKVIQTLLIEEPKAEYLQLGGYDEVGACSCPWCMEKLNTCYTQGGISIDMLNDMSIRLEEDKFFEKHPEVNKNVKLTFLSYLSYEQPPVDDNGKVYVVARDNVGAYWCPIDGCYSHAMDDPICEINKKTMKNLDGWSKVTKHLGVYVYGCNYRNYFTFLNNFGHFRPWAEMYQKYEMEYINYHAVVQFDYAPLDRLRHYLYNVYVDNPNAGDYDTIAKDFMDHYYKVASKDMWAYYEAVRLQNTVYTNETGWSCQRCFDDRNADGGYTDKRWWPWETLNNLLNHINNAYKAIDNSSLTLAEKTQLKDRIAIEEMTVRYWKYTYHSGYYTQDELEAEIEYLYDMADKLGITEMVL